MEDWDVTKDFDDSADIDEDLNDISESRDETTELTDAFAKEDVYDDHAPTSDVSQLQALLESAGAR